MRDISKETIERAAQGSIDAFEELYRIFSSYVYTVALKVTGNVEDAEEVTQDVFLSVHKHLRNFRGTSSFKTWIYRVTINRAITAYNKRKKQKFREINIDSEQENRIGVTTEDERQLSEKKEQIAEMLKKLPLSQREVLVLRAIEGLSYEEIAKSLRIKVNTVRSRLRRAREKMVAQFVARRKS